MQGLICQCPEWIDDSTKTTNACGDAVPQSAVTFLLVFVLVVTPLGGVFVSVTNFSILLLMNRQRSCCYPLKKDINAIRMIEQKKKGEAPRASPSSPFTTINWSSSRQFAPLLTAVVVLLVTAITLARLSGH